MDQIDTEKENWLKSLPWIDYTSTVCKDSEWKESEGGWIICVPEYIDFYKCGIDKFNCFFSFELLGPQWWAQKRFKSPLVGILL